MARISVGSVTEAYKGAYQRGMASVVQQLSNLGYNALQYAREQKEYTDKTFNLYASYACAVYLDGKMVNGTLRFLTRRNPAPHPDYDVNGREMAREFLMVQKPRNKVSVICVAAMPYAEKLEEGKHRGRREIQVISASTDFLEQHKNSINWGIFGGYKLARVFGGNTQYGRV